MVQPVRTASSVTSPIVTQGRTSGIYADSRFRNDDPAGEVLGRFALDDVVRTLAPEVGNDERVGSGRRRQSSSIFRRHVAALGLGAIAVVVERRFGNDHLDTVDEIEEW